MKNKEISLNVIEEYLAEKQRTAYKKMEGSSYEGYLYKIEDSQPGIIFNVDIRLTKQDAMIFEVYPGIRALSSCYIPCLALYCQQIATDFGAVYVDKERGNVEFHMETCFKENAITKETLAIFETEALRVLVLHYDNLNSLAQGKMILQHAIDNEVKKRKEVCQCYEEESIKACRDYLVKCSNHNAVCENVYNHKEVVFYSQIMTETDSFHLKYTFGNNGIFKIEGSYGEKNIVVPKEYQYLVADYLNGQNSRHMYSTLDIGNEETGFVGYIHTSLLDGEIGRETIEFLEMTLVQTLKEVVGHVETLCAGMPVTIIEEKEERGMDSILKHMLQEAESHAAKRMFSDRMGLKGIPDFSEKMGLIDEILADEEELKAEELSGGETSKKDVVNMEEFASMLDDDGNTEEE